MKTARGEFAEARAGWQGRVDELASDQDALAKEVEAVEVERDQALQTLDAARERARVELDAANAGTGEQ